MPGYACDEGEQDESRNEDDTAAQERESDPRPHRRHTPRRGTPLVSATLTLYTPNQTGPTGVLVYPNAPQPENPALWAPQPEFGAAPSWSSAPALLPGASGLAQSGSDGHWQRWDVTAIVQDWIRNGSRTNTGFTLVGTGAPVLFTSPQATPENSCLPDLCPGPCLQPVCNGPTPTPVSCGGPICPPDGTPTPPSLPSTTPTPLPTRCLGGAQLTLCTPTGPVCIVDVSAATCAGASPGPCVYGANTDTCVPGHQECYTTLVDGYVCVTVYGPDLPQTLPLPAPCTPWNMLPVTPPQSPAPGVVTTWCGIPETPMITVVYDARQSAAAVTDPGPLDDDTSNTFGVAHVANTADVDQVASPLNGSYVRFTMPIPCDNPTPGADWWNNHIVNKLVDAYSVMQEAYNQGLVPIVNITSGTACKENTDWYKAVYDFVGSMPNGGLQTRGGSGNFRKKTYFEIDNEENDLSAGYGPKNSNYYFEYPQFFRNAALGLRDALGTRGVNNYRIITGGMILPVAYKPPCRDASGYYNIDVAAQAVYDAENPSNVTSPPYGESGVDAGHLGVALHPYTFASGAHYNQYWRNYEQQNTYYQDSQNRYPSDMCHDLDGMNNTWKSRFAGLPIIYTEINSAGSDTDPTVQGRYMVDLMTYLWDNGYGDTSASPIRIAWERLQDAEVPLGIYTRSASQGGPPYNSKSAFILTCPTYGSSVEGSNRLDYDYRLLTYNPCY